MRRGVGGMFYGATKEIFHKAQMLRSSMTEAELILWDRLSDNKLAGFKFRRQHPISQYVVDFYCHKAMLVIEVDGRDHNQTEKKNNDEVRDIEMKELGLMVLRIKNEEVMDDIDNVLKRIEKELW
ncbi:MAG: endonuclease domain-containing protein [Cyclobacteriaceae bacterium]|nr:endonuclease domain-containing protein [Cyclobacteriaceae bacterium SS2]